MSGSDDKRKLKALEAELRRDRLEDPGDDFFADLEQRVMKQVADRPPRRPWWHLGSVRQWLWQPAPVAALAAAAAVALVVVWVGGPGGVEEVQLRDTVSFGGGSFTVRPAPRRSTSGEAWFAQLPPTEDLWAVEDRDLPALLALLAAEDPDEDDDALEAPLGEPVGEQSLNRLNEAQLRALERVLKKQQTRPKRRPARPRPAMGQAG